MTQTLTINRRFRGPRDSGNGGVSAGLAARFLDGPATVRLRRPPPLGRPLTVHRRSGTVDVIDEDDLVMQAGPSTRTVDPPIGDDQLARAFARGTTPVPEGYRAPECFVCGPRRDGLGICPAVLDGTDLWATVWIPDRSVSSDGRHVDPHILWGALDCPAGLAVVGYGRDPLTFFPALTSLTVSLHQPVPVGRPAAVCGWPIAVDEERLGAGTAIIDADGVVLAVGYAQHARLPIDFADR